MTDRSDLPFHVFALDEIERRGGLVERDGQWVPVDEAYLAWVSGDINRMVRALDVQTNAIDRHFLLLTLVEATYRRREEPEMRALCERVAEMHVAEFATLGPALRRDMHGRMPRVPTFQKIAQLYAADGRIDDAIIVCQTAMRYGVPDLTKSGWPGRIARFRRRLR